MAQPLRGVSTHLNEQKFPVPADIWADVGVISRADSLCGSHAFQHNFQLFVTQTCALYRKFLVSIQSSDRHSLPIAVIPLRH
jgi:hypothetical protein